MSTTPRLWKSLTQVNTTDAPAPMSGGLAFQFDGQVARLADGGYAVVWTDMSRAYNPGGQAVVGQRYDAAGNKVGGERNISGFDSGDQFSPAIAALPNGNVAVAFVDTSLGEDLYVRVYDSSLAGLVRTDFIDITLSPAFDPSITAFADGSYVVSYTVGSGADTDIVARIVSPTGVVGARFDVENSNDNRDFSEVATLGDGTFVVVYQDESGGNPTDTDIKYAIFSPTGTLLHGPRFVNAGNGPGLETDPDVAALGNENAFVAVWTDPDGPDSDDIIGAIISDRGITALAVNTTTAGVQDEASVVALADGGFLVTWEDETAGLVRGQRFSGGASRSAPSSPCRTGCPRWTARRPRCSPTAVSPTPWATCRPATPTWRPRSGPLPTRTALPSTTCSTAARGPMS